MLKHSKRSTKTRTKVVDAQVEEFERRDLGKELLSHGPLVMIRKHSRTSIVLDNALVSKLKEKAAKRGLGYQTMLKVIVHDHIDEY